MLPILFDPVHNQDPEAATLYSEHSEAPPLSTFDGESDNTETTFTPSLARSWALFGSDNTSDRLCYQVSLILLGLLSLAGSWIVSTDGRGELGEPIFSEDPSRQTYGSLLLMVGVALLCASVSIPQTPQGYLDQPGDDGVNDSVLYYYIV